MSGSNEARIDERSTLAVLDENRRLASEIHRLLRAEWKLYDVQAELDTERKAYEKLAEIGRRFHTDLDRNAMLRASCEFIVFELNYQRALLLRRQDDGLYRICASEGYYDSDETARVQERLVQLPFDALVAARPEVIRLAERPDDDPWRAIGAAVLLDEFMFTEFGEGPGGIGEPDWLAIVGSTKERRAFHTRIGHAEKSALILGNLLGQCSSALQTASLYEALKSERNSLERRVEARTKEIAEANEQLKVALLRAKESERLKLEFLANISHELRTPLNSIINLPEALLEDFQLRNLAECSACEALFEIERGDRADGNTRCPECEAVGTLRGRAGRVYVGDPELGRRHLELVRDCGQHLLVVINDILDASRLETGRMSFQSSRVQVSMLLSRARSASVGLSERRGVEIAWPAISAGLELECDAVRIVQVLVNIIGNAVKFSNAGQVVTVQVEEHDDLVRFVVIDQGIGIEPANQELIFAPFRQVEGGNTRRYGGSGLGLAISRRIVDEHRGTIRVESALGVGSRFEVSLPRTSARPLGTQSDPEVVRAEPGSKPVVIVVDDDDAALEAARWALKGLEAHVVTVGDPSRALEHVEELQPHLVLLDMRMPGIDARTFLECVRGLPGRQPRVLLVSAYDDVEQFAAEHRVPYLAKPWDPSLLFEAVERSLKSTEEHA